MRKSDDSWPPVCPYCDQPAKTTTGASIYPHLPELALKSFWRCVPCDAYVGCHKGTTRPLGRLANSLLRAAKVAAHEAFDPLWRSKMVSRRRAYSLLADALGIDGRDCHIGEFDLDMCTKVVTACKEIAEGEAALRHWREHGEVERARIVEAIRDGSFVGGRDALLVAKVLAYVGRGKKRG